MTRLVRLLVLLLLAPCGALLVDARPAQAIPAFAGQTGQPCTACHVGGYGPQLTPFGRAFKIGGYTQRGGEGLASEIPLSLMVITSFNNTSSGVPADQVMHHYNDNNNFSLDQISGFIGGGIGDHTGGLMQLTWTDIDNTSHVDNTDLRPYTTVFNVGGKELRIGTTLNNNPTVQDPYNSTFAWGYPYVASGIAPTPAANPMLAGAFAANSIGYTVYGWYDNKLYLEGGAYNTWSPWTLARFGNDYNIGSINGAAPYLRAAYEWQWGQSAAHIGALFMYANVNPPTGEPFSTSGANGSDNYTDIALDAGYQFLGDGTHMVVAQGIFTHENQNLGGSASGTGFGSHYSLNQLRANIQYWYKNTYGVTLGIQTTWGPANPVLYPTAELYGSANNRPNSNAFIMEADWVPFGKENSLWAPFANMKLGIQYTAYTMFNGGTSNYDGFGRSASANNTLFLFAWFVF